MSNRIDTVAARAKLKPRRAPYWQRISMGCHVGFRRLSTSSIGSWLLQSYDPATQSQRRESIGSLAEFPGHRQFDEAKRLAESKFAHLASGGSAEIVTVRAVCERYVESKNNAKQVKHGQELNARFTRHVFSSKIAELALEKLTHHHVAQWRNELTMKPVIRSIHSKERLETVRSPSTINRDMTALRAALNFAHDERLVAANNAWRTALKPIKNADRRRTDYLDKDDRRRLIASAAPDISLFLRGLALLPLRPGALANLKTEDYDPKLKVLTIGRDKHGGGRQIRLPANTAKFVDSLTSSGRLANGKGSAAIFRRADGSAWNKDAWKKPIKQAAKISRLNDSVTAYTLRHSVITDLIVEARLDLLTVAQLSGTSIIMIEKHYGHLRLDHAAKALDSLTMIDMETDNAKV